MFDFQKMRRKKYIFYVINVDSFFLSHRLPLALQALRNGYEVYAVTKDTGKREEIEQYGIHFIDVPFKRSGRNVFHELKCIAILTKLYRVYNPDIIHQVTLKATILGSIAAKRAKIKNVVNAISGFGYNFTNERKGLFQYILKRLLITAFKSNYFYYIVQNLDDKRILQSLCPTPNNHIKLIKGSGVDLKEFGYSLPREKEYIAYLFPARILLDKGVIEFIQASKSLKKELYGKAKFILAGLCDTENLAALSENKLKELLEDNFIEWIGFQDNMIDVYRKADVVVLPSYREGLPKSLIEACAIGRPIITTNTPGCRECIINEFNGLMVPVKNVQSLAEAILRLFNHTEERLKMGLNSRKMAEKYFSIDSVVEKTFSIYDELLINNKS